MADFGVLENFRIKGTIDSVALFGSGHINDTYHVSTSEAGYLLQKINTAVFQDVDSLEANLKGLFSKDSEILVEHIRTKKNGWLHTDDSGVWKVQVFDQNTYAPQVSNDLTIVIEVGRGFGRFMTLGETLNVADFEEAIPNFHDLSWRLDQLDDAIKKDKVQRMLKAQALVDKANDFRWISSKMDELVQQGLPLRVCHNDTKIDNILLSKADNGFKYVIDLDTAGPGYVLYDFGDMMRTLLSPTKEAELDDSKIELRKDYFEVLRSGFLKECESILTEIEVRNLTFGGLYMTYMMAIRFLADYLNGDVYYRVGHEEENFIRARNQLRLLELMNNQL